MSDVSFDCEVQAGFDFKDGQMEVGPEVALLCLLRALRQEPRMPLRAGSGHPVPWLPVLPRDWRVHARPGPTTNNAFIEVFGSALPSGQRNGRG